MKKQISVNEAFKRLNSEKFDETKSLNESVELTEAQLTVDKFQQSQFPKVPVRQLERVVQIDPTYNDEKKVVGKYAKWLCNLAFKRNVDVLKDANEYSDQLARFNSIFNQLPQDKRDLQKIKSIEELIELNATIQDEKVDMTEFELNAEKRDDVIKVGKVKDWDIYTPKTWEASKWIRNSGDGAEWCTGWSDRRTYYDRYQGDGFVNGRLYIFQNKDLNAKRPFNKFQLSVYTKENGVREFKDASNSYNNLGGQNDTENFILFLSKYGLADGVSKIKEIDDKVHAAIQDAKDLETAASEPYVYGEDKEPGRLIRNVVTKIVVPEGITALKLSAFANFGNVTSIQLPHSLQSLGESKHVSSSSGQVFNRPTTTFKNCKSLSKIVIPENVKVIPGECFYGCENLKEIYIMSTDAIKFARDCFSNIGTNDYKINLYLQPDENGKRHLTADSNEGSILKRHMVLHKSLPTNESLDEGYLDNLKRIKNEIVDAKMKGKTSKEYTDLIANYGSLSNANKELKDIEAKIKNFESKNESLKEEKEDEVKEVKNEYLDKIIFLADDEVEAIEGYDSAIELFSECDCEQKDEVIEMLTHIKEEEVEHIRELKELLEKLGGNQLSDKAEELISEEPKEDSELNLDTNIEDGMQELDLDDVEVIESLNESNENINYNEFALVNHKGDDNYGLGRDSFISQQEYDDYPSAEYITNGQWAEFLKKHNVKNQYWLGFEDIIDELMNNESYSKEDLIEYAKENPNELVYLGSDGKYFNYDLTVNGVTIDDNNVTADNLEEAKSKILDSISKAGGWEKLNKNESLKEDAVKVKDGKWTNKGKEGTHGNFRTKKGADNQRKAMFANGYKESLDNDLRIFEVNFNKISDMPPFTKVNDSCYVKANDEDEAIKIVIEKLHLDEKDINDVWELNLI